MAHCKSNNRKMNWSHYGRCLSGLLNNPIGIAEYHPWRVCGVTPEALNQIMKNGSNKGIQRGHIVSQLDIAKLLLSPSQLHSKQLFEQVLSTFDVTVLMTTEQNNRMTKDATIPFEYIEIHNPISELFTAQYRGYRFRKGYELSRLREINNAPR